MEEEASTSSLGLLGAAGGADAELSARLVKVYERLQEIDAFGVEIDVWTHRNRRS